MSTILLIGNDGQVGYELERTLASLGTVTAICYPAIDFASPDSITRVVRNTRPGLIVNAAAYTAVDKAESDPETCWKLNTMAPAILADEARRLGAGLVHYSTDFVFDGQKNSPYTEDDTPNPLGVYGKTKAEGDYAIAAAGIPHLIFRLAWVYGMRGKNFLLTMQRLAGEGKPIRVVADQIGCPTWCRTIAEATSAVLSKTRTRRGSFDLGDVRGTYHCVCSGETSWHGFARAIIPEAIPVTPIVTSDYPTPARRPAYSALDCGKLKRTFGITMPAWQAALATCMKSGTPGGAS